MINPSEIDLSTLPSVALEAKSAFPQQPAVYFAIDNQSVIQYIGRAANLHRRWLHHHRCDQLSRMDSVRVAYLISDADSLPEIEKSMIEWFSPRLNRNAVIKSAVATRRNPRSRRIFSRLPNLMVNKNPRMTRQKLAAELKLSHITINKMYNGQPLTARIDPKTVEALCNYFGCDVGDLLIMKEGDA